MISALRYLMSANSFTDGVNFWVHPFCGYKKLQPKVYIRLSYCWSGYRIELWT